MPKSAIKPCLKPGCGETFRGPGAYCEEHQTKRQKEIWKAKAKVEREKNPREQRFYNSTEWELCRKAQLRREPFCRMCVRLGREHQFAEMVDHIKPLRLHWELRLDPANLQSLCHKCHNKKRARERKLYE